jgi:hypothetical protein
MFALRWPIGIVLGLLVALGWGGWRDRDAPEPATEPEPSGEAQPAEQPQAEPPPAPDQVHNGPLFPEGLPMATLALPEGLANPTAQGCAACHGAIHDQWAGSAHASGWSGGHYTQTVALASEPETCLACHLPYAAQHPRRVVHHAEGDASAPQHAVNPDWNPTLQAEGVTCASCHLRDGQVLGPRASDQAPHPVSTSEALRSPTLCAACHQLDWPESELAWYDTYGEWYRSPYREAGVSCQDCHMPPQAGPVTTGRFASHAGHAMAVDPSRALSVLLDLDSPTVTRGQPYTLRLRLQNTGAGHAFPTGHPGKAITLRAAVHCDDGGPLHEPFTHELVRRAQQGPPFALLEDTRIPARGELTLEHEATIPHKKPSGACLLRVTFSDDLHEQTLFERAFPVTVL